MRPKRSDQDVFIKFFVNPFNTGPEILHILMGKQVYSFRNNVIICLYNFTCCKPGIRYQEKSDRTHIIVSRYVPYHCMMENNSDFIPIVEGIWL